MTSSNLTLIETVTSAKLANKINSQVKQGTLGVFVQVMASSYVLSSQSRESQSESLKGQSESLKSQSKVIQNSIGVNQE